jgi:hypothetical protein
MRSVDVTLARVPFLLIKAPQKTLTTSFDWRVTVTEREEVAPDIDDSSSWYDMVVIFTYESVESLEGKLEGCAEGIIDGCWLGTHEG